MMNKFIRFYNISPSIPGSLIKNIVYKILWRLNLVESPSLGKYKDYISYKKIWSEVGDILDYR